MKPTVKNPDQKVKSYRSPLLDKLLAERNPAETARTEARMLLAVRIADALEEKGMSKKELAAIASYFWARILNCGFHAWLLF